MLSIKFLTNQHPNRFTYHFTFLFLCVYYYFCADVLILVLIPVFKRHKPLLFIFIYKRLCITTILLFQTYNPYMICSIRSVQGFLNAGNRGRDLSPAMGVTSQRLIIILYCPINQTLDGV